MCLSLLNASSGVAFAFIGSLRMMGRLFTKAVLLCISLLSQRFLRRSSYGSAFICSTIVAVSVACEFVNRRAVMFPVVISGVLLNFVIHTSHKSVNTASLAVDTYTMTSS